MVTTRNLPSRLHHTAYTTKDMEKTREFYEEVIGLPLVATWSESDELFGRCAPTVTASSALRMAARSRSSSSPIRTTRGRLAANRRDTLSSHRAQGR